MSPTAVEHFQIWLTRCGYIVIKSKGWMLTLVWSSLRLPASNLRCLSAYLRKAPRDQDDLSLEIGESDSMIKETYNHNWGTIAGLTLLEASDCLRKSPILLIYHTLLKSSPPALGAPQGTLSMLGLKASIDLRCHHQRG